ncbi:hypothetical protein P7K49_037737, partial [Saguinus oedipus]
KSHLSEGAGFTETWVKQMTHSSTHTGGLQTRSSSSASGQPREEAVVPEQPMT